MVRKLRTQDHAGMSPTLSAIGEGVGIAPSTAQRYVRMFVKQGLVVRTKHGLFARDLNVPEAVWMTFVPAPVEMPQFTWRTILASLARGCLPFCPSFGRRKLTHDIEKVSLREELQNTRDFPTLL